MAEQIDFLGGTPSTSVPNVKSTTDAPKKVLKQDLNLETNQLARYRERVDQANEMGLPDVAEALALFCIKRKTMYKTSEPLWANREL